MHFTLALRGHPAVTRLTVYRWLQVYGISVFDEGLLTMDLFVCSKASKSPRESLKLATCKRALQSVHLVKIYGPKKQLVKDSEFVKIFSL